MGDVAGSASESREMPLPVWQQVPPTTAVRDLYRTSLLACSDDPASGVLLRCGAGLEDGSTTIVHAKASHPNALTMTGVDDDTHIVAQARLLLGDTTVHVVAIPHIAWKCLGGGLPRRTPIAAVIAVLVAVLLVLPPVALSAWVALPVAAVLGLLAWLLLRERLPTRIGSSSELPMAADAVVEHVRLCLNGRPAEGAATNNSRAGAHRWVPPVGCPHGQPIPRTH